jgi:hypothetical protein
MALPLAATEKIRRMIENNIFLKVVFFYTTILTTNKNLKPQRAPRTRRKELFPLCVSSRPRRFINILQKSCFYFVKNFAQKTQFCGCV